MTNHTPFQTMIEFASAAMYRSLFECNHAANMLLKDGLFIDCNAEALRLFGCPDKQTFCALSPGKLSPACQPDGTDSMVGINQCIQAAVKQGFHRVEWLHQRLDGSPFDAEVLLTPVSMGDELMIQATVLDISKAKRDSQQLQQRLAIEETLAQISRLLLSPQQVDLEQILQLLGEAVGVDRAYLFQLRRDHRTIMDNSFEWCAAGVSAQINDLQGLRTALFPWWMHQMQQGLDVMIASVAQLPDAAGAEREVLQAQGIQALLAVPMMTAAGELAGFIGFDDVKDERVWQEHDVRVLRIAAEMIHATLERNHLQQALQVREQKLERNREDLLLAQEIAHLGNWEFYLDSSKTNRISKEIFRIFGLPDTTLGTFKTFLKHVYPDDLAEVRRTIRQAYSEGSLQAVQYRIKRADGEIRSVQANGECYRDRQTGKPVRFFGTLQDITERVEMEKLQVAVARAKAENSAKSDFLAVMSHELRTPLHGIIGLQDLLAQELKDISPRHKEHLDMAQHSARMLSVLIDDVLDLSKIEAGSMQLHATTFALPSLLHDALSMFFVRAREKGLALELDLIDIPAQICADAMRIRQILLNIVGNAVKFTEHGGICLNVSMPANKLQLEIRDTGIGIADADIERLFEPFLQFSRDASRHGSGLGTTIAKRFSNMMGGDIVVQSELGKGSTFSIALSVEVVGEERTSSHNMISPPLPDIPSATNQPDLGGLKLLLAEDDPIARFLALDSLQAAGLQVVAAENGQIAWEMLQEDDYDLLLTDIRMPVMDGIALTRKVRAMELPGGKRLRIIGLSAHAMAYVAEDAYAAGMDDFIAKPIEPEALMRRLRGAAPDDR